MFLGFTYKHDNEKIVDFFNDYFANMREIKIKCECCPLKEKCDLDTSGKTCQEFILESFEIKE